MIGGLVAFVSRGKSAAPSQELRSRLQTTKTTATQHDRSFQWGAISLAATSHPLSGVSADSFSPAVFDGSHYCAFFWGQLDRSSAPLSPTLSAIIDQGPPAAAALSGDFVLLLVDRQQPTLTVIRDQLGGRCAFWRDTPAGTWIATDEQCLWPKKPQPEARYLASFFAAQSPPATATPIEGISALPPAHWMKVSPHGVSGPRRYWQFAYDSGARKLNPPQAAEDLRARLKDAVSDRVFSDDAVAISGGMDSTAIAAVGNFQQAFTYRLDDWPQCQEHELADRTCRHLKVALHEVNCDQAAPLSDEFWETPNGNAGPEFDAYRVMRWQLAQAARNNGCHGIVTGDFADQLYLGYPYSLRDGFLSEPAAYMMAAVRRLRHAPLFWRDPLLRRMGPANGISRGLRKPSQPWLTHHAQQLLSAGSRSHPIYGEIPQVDRMEGCLNAGTARAAHLGYLQGLQWGVEYRLPYRHLALVQFLLSLSANNWLDPISGQTKPVMRQAMTGLLPSAVVNRTDKTSLEPLFRHAVLGTHVDQVRQRLASSDVWQDYVEPHWIEQRWRRNDWNGSSLYLLWCCISASHWSNTTLRTWQPPESDEFIDSGRAKG